METALPAFCLFGLMLTTSMSKADDLLISDVNVVDVAESMRADLLLLDGNPLDDIRHSTSVSAVLRDGELIER